MAEEARIADHLERINGRDATKQALKSASRSAFWAMVAAIASAFGALASAYHSWPRK